MEVVFIGVIWQTKQEENTLWESELGVKEGCGDDVHVGLCYM